MAETRPRGRDTRRRILDAALALFLERGYDQTSLREIAERLDVTKAALYYHFKTKEDIVGALLQRLVGPVDELIAWGSAQPRTLDTKLELLRRLHAALHESEPVFRFLHENQAALRRHRGGGNVKDRLTAIGELVTPPRPGPLGQARAMSAIFTVYFGTFAMIEIDGDPVAQRAALLEVAEELLRAAEDAPSAPHDAPGAPGDVADAPPGVPHGAADGRADA